MSSTAIPDNIPYNNIQVTENIIPLLIGIYISFTLFGIGLFQFWQVTDLLWQSSANETTNWLILGGFFILDLTDQITKAMFFAENIRGAAIKGLAVAFFPSPSIIVSLGVFGGLIPTAVHLFYIKRLYRISRTWKYRSIVWVVLSACLVTSIVALVWAIKSGIFGMKPASEYFPTIKTLPVPWLAGDAAVDGVLCLMLSLYLFSQRTDFKSTNRLLARWIALTLETGFIPAGFALADLLLAIYHPEKPYHFAVNFVLSKAYINSVLVLFYTVTRNRVVGTHGSNSRSNNSNSHPLAPRYVNSKMTAADSVIVTTQQETIHESPSHTVRLGGPGIVKGTDETMSLQDKEKYYA